MSARAYTILLVENYPAQAMKLTSAFEEEGWRVRWAVSGDAAFSSLRERLPDLVLLNERLPDQSGDEICRQIRQMSDHSLPIVMLVSEEHDDLHDFEGGVDDFVVKTDDPSELKGRIRALLRQRFLMEEDSHAVQELRAKELESLRESASREVAADRAVLVGKLEQSNRDLQRSREDLKKANDARDRLLAILSHELRTPLTPILAVVTQRAEDETLPAELRRDLSMIKRNVELEARLIDDLLDLTRIMDGKLEVRSDEVDLQPLIEHVVEIAVNSDQPVPQIATEFTVERSMVRGDSARLTQVFWNLLRNATKFTPIDGRVTLRLFNNRDYDGATSVVFEVIDTGIGIDAEALPRIFTAFEQGNRQIARQFGGLGIGLAISKAIIDLHGGTLKAHSLGRGQGAIFSVSLPVHLDLFSQNLIPPPPIPAEPVATASEARDRATHVLLVEDHEDTREILSRLLTMRGYRVSVASSVAAARQQASSLAQIDVLISDVGLPDGNGFDALRAVSEIQPVRGIALSGYGMESDVQQSLAAGFVSHLTKPVDFERLDKEISHILTIPLPATSEKPSPVVPGMDLRILLVEDNADTASVMEIILKSMGHRITLATTISEALAAALKEKFDLIISDIGLPDGHGISLLTGVRQFCDTPAIALTAYGMQEDIDRCLKAGFGIHLTKPVDKEQLRSAILKMTSV